MTCHRSSGRGGGALAGFLFVFVSTCSHAIRITTPAAFCPSPSLLRSSSFGPMIPIQQIEGLQHRRSTTFLSMTSTQKNQETNQEEEDAQKDQKKIVYKRVLYTLSENTDNLKPEHRYSIEDRCQYELNNDKTEEVPVGLRTFIIRGPAPVDDFPPPPPKEQQEELTPEGKKKMPPLPYTRVGPELYRMTVHDTLNGKTHGGLGEHGVKDGIVMALYVMMQPQWMKGKVLELSSGVGMGGLLSALGAGLALPDDDEALDDEEDEENDEGEYVSIEDIASKPIPKKEVEEKEEEENVLHPDESDHHPKAPVPTKLDSITLTDESESRLNIALKNCKSSNIKPSKVYLNTMDFAMPVPKEQRNQYTTILGSDLIYSFVDAKRVSKIVAFSLVPSPYDRNIGRQTHIGQFVHVGPKNRDSILDLKKKLREGYLMNVYGTNLNLDVIVLADLILNDKDTEEKKKEEELMIENGGWTEYLGKLRPTSYQTLVAEHHEDYDGYNGEWMWPAENGSEENRNARRDIEPDVGYGGYKGGGRGSRRTGVW